MVNIGKDKSRITSELMRMLKNMDPVDREVFIKNELSNDEILEITYNWEYWARDDQLLPRGEWFVWLIQAGRGWGKTRTGSEIVHVWKKQGYKRFALVAKTPQDAYKVMVEGKSGILQTAPPWDKPRYIKNQSAIIWNDGTRADIYSGANPEQLRGPEFEKAWADEIFAWQYAQETYDMLTMCTRIGDNPQIIITSTPKNTALIKAIRKDPGTKITRGTTFDNIENLNKSFINTVINKYEGTRLGRQELYAEILDDNPGALWNRATLDASRIKLEDCPPLIRVGIAVDPSVSVGDGSNETGIIMGGIDANGEGYVLKDLTTDGSPAKWGKRVADSYNDELLDIVIYEENQGGLLVEQNIKTFDRNINTKGVRATKGKVTRAEPIASLFEQGKIHIVGNIMKLEDQLCDWEPGKPSPDRLDAMVWLFTELILNSTRSRKILTSPGDIVDTGKVNLTGNKRFTLGGGGIGQ